MNIFRNVYYDSISYIIKKVQVDYVFEIKKKLVTVNDSTFFPFEKTAEIFLIQMPLHGLIMHRMLVVFQGIAEPLLSNPVLKEKMSMKIKIQQY